MIQLMLHKYSGKAIKLPKIVTSNSLHGVKSIHISKDNYLFSKGAAYELEEDIDFSINTDKNTITFRTSLTRKLAKKLSIDKKFLIAVDYR